MPAHAALSIRQIEGDEVEAVVPLLMLAEPSRRALDWSLENLSDAAYRLDVGGKLIGAATVRWDDEPCEIVELAIAAEEQGRGFGKAFVEWLLDEARRRHK